MTSRPLDIPGSLADSVEVSDRTAPDLLTELDSRGFERAYVDGGAVIQSFLRAGLVDELIVTQVPVLIGDGIALFGELSADIWLDHVDTVVFENGCVQTRYTVGRG